PLVAVIPLVNNGTSQECLRLISRNHSHLFFISSILLLPEYNQPSNPINASIIHCNRHFNQHSNQPSNTINASNTHINQSDCGGLYSFRTIGRLVNQPSTSLTSDRGGLYSFRTIGRLVTTTSITPPLRSIASSTKFTSLTAGFGFRTIGRLSDRGGLRLQDNRQTGQPSTSITTSIPLPEHSHLLTTLPHLNSSSHSLLWPLFRWLITEFPRTSSPTHHPIPSTLQSSTATDTSINTPTNHPVQPTIQSNQPSSPTNLTIQPTIQSNRTSNPINASIIQSNQASSPTDHPIPSTLQSSTATDTSINTPTNHPIQPSNPTIQSNHPVQPTLQSSTAIDTSINTPTNHPIQSTLQSSTATSLTVAASGFRTIGRLSDRGVLYSFRTIGRLINQPSISHFDPPPLRSLFRNILTSLPPFLISIHHLTASCGRYSAG
ncbi:hypothetical protein N7465_002353, partial [Penicillium sp. CMV-2018d]